jgi:hypothetical protein
MLPAGWAAARLATTMSLVAMAAVTVLGRSAAAWTGGAIVVITASLAWRQLELAPMVASLPPTTRLPRG